MEDKLKQGEAFFTEGKIEEAKECFLKILKHDSLNKEAFNNLGVIAFHQQDIEEAVQHFTKALEIDPFYKDAVLNYADVLRSLGLIHQAVPILEKVIEKHPDDQELSQLMNEAYKARHHAEPLPGSPGRKISSQSEESRTTFTSWKASGGKKEDPLAGKKILHAPLEIAGNMARITRFLRGEGVDATSASYMDDSWLKCKCDINLNINNLPENKRLKAIDDFAKEAIDKYDIFHFHFAKSLYPDFRDLEELKQKGKKIIFQFWGSDQRSPEWIYYQQARFLGYRPPKPYFVTMSQYHVHKIINRYADVMIGLTCIPRGFWITGFVETLEWSMKEKERILREEIMKKDPHKTYFVHAPSTNWKKGSSVIVRLLEECKNDGMPIELLHVSQLQLEKAKQIYPYADFAIDQVGVGTFGLFGCEMMCWQIPVLVYHIDLFDRLRNFPPIIKITKENFKRQIANCIEMKKSGELIELGKKGRRWAIENVDISLGLSEYLRIYRDLAEGRQVKQYVNTSWYEEEHRLQGGFKSDFYKYMIEERVFEELGVGVSSYDKRLYH
ncbi:MAG: tetratricopeptide repeat protein [Desulfobacteraceae bacterium]|nr:tetratricopeptide repeat protein [Desulfobacteraceae bacterium]